MKRIISSHWPFGGLLILLSFFYVWGIRFVPFHPDETTYLFMSSDFEALFSNPKSLYWQPDKIGDPQQQYRTIDAPLTRYLIGLGRTVAGLEALPTDWDWGAPWDTNLQQGAYPNPELLFTGRLTITLLLPVSLILIYNIGIQLQGKLTGFLGALLLGSHAIILLHSRRAMTEGVLVFGILLTVWACLQLKLKPWLIGLGLATAINAKHSALGMVPVCLIALIWLPLKVERRFRKIIINLLQFGTVLIVITIALNPVYWQNPLQAGLASVNTRSQLTQQQIQDTRAIAPEKYLASASQRSFVLFANIFVGPAEHSLVGNLEPTMENVARYIANPGHNLMRGLGWGALGLGLTLLGFYMAMRNIFAQDEFKRRFITLFILAGVIQIGATIAVVPLPWARFSVPVIPFVCLFMAYGIAQLSPKRTPDQA
jgi:4-amino-4-deoxy-L-arabinose transferase-like glycosyltransferase